MELLPILERYQTRFRAHYNDRLTRDQRRALDAMLDCRTARFGEMQLHCPACQHHHSAFHACGHRSCPRCQQHDTAQWLERQQRKLLPVNYFMVTFTLPAELRSLARRHPKTVYPVLFDCAVSTLKDFGANSARLGADMGMTAVLHTHSRRLDYHPHVHVVVAGGCLNKARKQWKRLRGRYLFNEQNLARVFRARVLAALRQADCILPERLPARWVVDCQCVGKGLPALTYLARYLYRGVISESNIIADDGTHVTFRYKDSRTGQYQTRTVTGETFIWLLLQHVLPRGFRRVRDFGFLHGNAKKSLKVIQWALGLIVPLMAAKSRPPFLCALCHHPMSVIAFIRPAWRPG